MINFNETMQDDLKFEQLIATFTEPEKFLARQLREVQKECAARKICSMPQFTRKQIGIGISGVSAISAIIVGLIELAKALINRGG